MKNKYYYILTLLFCSNFCLAKQPWPISKSEICGVLKKGGDIEIWVVEDESKWNSESLKDSFAILNEVDRELFFSIISEKESKSISWSVTKDGAVKLVYPLEGKDIVIYNILLSELRSYCEGDLEWGFQGVIKTMK